MFSSLLFQLFVLLRCLLLQLLMFLLLLSHIFCVSSLGDCHMPPKNHFCFDIACIVEELLNRVPQKQENLFSQCDMLWYDRFFLRQQAITIVYSFCRVQKTTSHHTQQYHLVEQAVLWN